MTAVADRPTTGRRPLFARPTATTGWKSWFTTIDHKKLGLLYCGTALVFFVVGGIEALAIRAQLATPDGSVLTADQYSQIFTMHGLTMIFFFVMPFSVGMMNYMLPLQIGARDVAFPRLNAVSYWIFLSAGIFLYSSVLTSGMPDGSWVNYATLSTIGPDPAQLSDVTANANHAGRMLYYSLGLQIAGIASLAGAVNFIVTIFNMRAPGMTLLRMPVFAWMTFVVAFLLLFAMPVIGIALWQLMFETRWEAPFFNVAAGGEPVLWQHLFWLFGHPEVYIMILPAFGIVSEILPVFSRKPLFGYTAIVFSGIAIGFLGWGVWAHHMFTVGLGPVANAAFGITTMLIAVPTGIKIFNWIGTMWGGRIRFRTPMLFAIGLVTMFTIGGLSGVTHAVVPHDTQQHDTYYVVAHFHYVLFGGAVFGLLGGVYYWFPKAFGKMMSEKLGKLHFWLMLIGFNLTFGPHHLLGLNGMPRRIYTYPDGMGWNLWNLVSTIGAFTIALSILVFIINLVVSHKRGEPAGTDPWDARTLEWLTASPPAEHNFDEIPIVTSRDELWHRKYAGDGGDREPVRVPAGASADHPADAEHADHAAHGEPAEHGAAHSGHAIHMPAPSYYPVVIALGLPIAAYGVFFAGLLQIALFAIGGVLIFGGMAAWVTEPSFEEAH